MIFDSVEVHYTFSPSLQGQGRNNFVTPVTFCDEWEVCIQPCYAFKNGNKNASRSSDCCAVWLTGEICTTEWVWIPSGGGGGGGTGGGDGGGGGGGGGSPPPCGTGNPGRNNLVSPCGPGWEPIPPIEATFGEFYFNSGPGIDLQKYFNCFDNIPDAGATYSIKIRADLPRNCCPGNIMTTDLAPGHAFITLTKSNGTQSITQSFGFYPTNGLKSTLMIPEPSKIVDDGGHEYNASLSMNISSIDFNAAKNLALSTSTLLYDLKDYNCTDFALDCFNIARPLSQQITIGRLPGWGIIKSTPNMLYLELLARQVNGQEAANIEIGVFNAPQSYGPCN